MPRIVAAWLVSAFCLAALLVPRPGHAATFDYSSTCATFADGSLFGTCSSFGLGDGDSVSGTISILDSALTANNTLDASDLTGFNFTFGDLTFSIADATAVNFSATVNAAANNLSSFSLMAAAIVDDSGNTYGNGIYLTQDDWTATRTGACAEPDCANGELLLGFDVLTVSSTFTPPAGKASLTLEQQTNPPPPEDVPEPASFTLLAASLLGLTALRRRARR